jgi:hypothetical protein
MEINNEDLPTDLKASLALMQKLQSKLKYISKIIHLLINEKLIHVKIGIFE